MSWWMWNRLLKQIWRIGSWAGMCPAIWSTATPNPSNRTIFCCPFLKPLLLVDNSVQKSKINYKNHSPLSSPIEYFCADIVKSQRNIILEIYVSTLWVYFVLLNYLNLWRSDCWYIHLKVTHHMTIWYIQLGQNCFIDY